MKLKPMKNRVVIKYLETTNVTSGGIIMPINKEEVPTLGKVVASGIDELGEKLNEGDTVMFSKYAGTKITIQNEDFVIMKYSEILAVIEK